MELKDINTPLLRKGAESGRMMACTLAALLVHALYFSLNYYPGYIISFTACLAAGAAVEWIYTLLKNHASSTPRASTLVTAALLSLSLPAAMPLHAVLPGVLVAVLFGKLIPGPDSIRLNPMLLGRLFVMLVSADLSQRWLLPGTGADALSSATPLGLYASEHQMVSLPGVLAGRIGGTWEGIYAIVPGAPGETLPAIALLLGTTLYFTGILDWRPAVMYVAGMAAGCLAFDMPVVFHVICGSTFFTAAYVITDPRSTPASKAGRLTAGLLAGFINAGVRKHGFYPEGPVIAILFVNLLSPLIDRICFTLRSRQLSRTASSYL